MQRRLRSSSVLAKGNQNVNTIIETPASKVKGALVAREPRTPPRKRARVRSPSSDAVKDDYQEITSPDKTPVSKNNSILSESRPVEPHRTNAILKTPGGTKLVPSTDQAKEVSPTKLRLSKPPTVSTNDLLEQACRHLIAVDSKMQPLIKAHPCRLFSPEGLAEVVDPFQSLVSGIMSQQVSGAAAKSIKQKFIHLFNDPGRETSSETQAFPMPDQIASKTVPILRQAGLSERKAEYIKGLAEKFRDGDLSAQMLITASDEEVLEKLTAVRGLGKWSVEMFSCFSLKRMDIFSTGDLGVQ